MDYSFIIPAYNAENTVISTIKSIEKRIPEAEIIVVENGSSDDTYETVKRHSANNPNLVLLKSEKGVSAARNAGLKRASGEWVIFVDADDLWVSKRDRLKALTGEPADMIICSYRKGRGSVVFDFASRDVAEVRTWMMNRPTQRMIVWAKIYRREFLTENNLYFNTALWVTEDSEFLVRCLKVCKSIRVSQEIIYKNQLVESSVTRTVNQRRISGHLDALRSVEKEVEYDAAFMNYILAHVNLIAVHDLFNCEIKRSWKERVQGLKKLLNEAVIKKQLDKVHLSANVQLLPSFLFKHKMYSLGGLICYAKSVANRRAYNS